MLQSSFVCGKRFLDTMSAEDRAFFVKTVQDASTKYSKIVADEETGFFDNFTKNGGAIVEVDLAEFENAMAPLYTNNDLGFSDGLKDRFTQELGL